MESIEFGIISEYTMGKYMMYDAQGPAGSPQ